VNSREKARDRTAPLLAAIASCDIVPRVGRVTQVQGMAVEANGPDVFVGELCTIYPPSPLPPIVAEVVGFRAGKVVMMPYGDMRGVYAGSEITATGQFATVPVGPAYLGRVVDAFGGAVDGEGTIRCVDHYPLYPPPINHLTRRPIRDIFDTGIGVIDTCLTLGKGQRIGIFSGSGVGKSTVLGMIARNSQAEVNVIALIGERGREVKDFIEQNLGRDGLARSVVIVAAADQPALVRTRAAFAATAIAEYYRDQGHEVMLAMDSVTRFAMAQREIGLALGEPPTSRGYTPSSFSLLPKLLERAGSFETGGTLTAFYTVLVEGDDFNEPVADNLRATLDGHIVLSRRLAQQGYLPAVSLLESVSRLQGAIVTDAHLGLVTEIRKLLSVYEENKDIVEMGVYQSGGNSVLDKALSVIPELRKIFIQAPSRQVLRADVMASLAALLNRFDNIERARMEPLRGNAQ
jgi:flagellum-specific ATP synthase